PRPAPQRRSPASPRRGRRAPAPTPRPPPPATALIISDAPDPNLASNARAASSEVGPEAPSSTGILHCCARTRARALERGRARGALEHGEPPLLRELARARLVAEQPERLGGRPYERDPGG